VTTWAYLLLAAYVGLGVSRRLTWRKATLWAVGLTAVIAAYVFTSYHALR
jgi:hypothetical protein